MRPLFPAKWGSQGVSWDLYYEKQGENPSFALWREQKAEKRFKTFWPSSFSALFLGDQRTQRHGDGR